MGIYVELFIEPSRIDADAWAEFYDDALAMLRAHPDELFGRRYRPGGADHGWYYARELEHDADDPDNRQFSVCGDMKSLETGESFHLYRSLQHYMDPGSAERSRDIVLAMLEEPDLPVTVFYKKTQGRSFHFPMLAVALLAEHRFPKAAYASGDIDQQQAEKARTWAQEQLGRPLSLPVCTDATALLDRLSPHLEGDALADALIELHRASPVRGHTALFQLGLEAARAWSRRHLGSYTSANLVGVVRHFIDWLNADGDLRTLLEDACHHPEGPRFPPADVIASLASTWTALTPDQAEFLTPLWTPEGETHSQYTQLCGMLFDVSMGGWRIRRHLPVSEVLQTIRDSFPGEGGALAELFEKENAEVMENLDKQRDVFNTWAEKTEKKIEATDPEDMRRSTRWEDLSEQAQAMLLQFGTTVCKWWARLQAEQESEEIRSLLETGGLRNGAVRLLEVTHFTLTEDAWAWIESEEDPRVLTFLVMVALLDYHELKFSELRRDVLESRSLCHVLVKAVHDQFQSAT